MKLSLKQASEQTGKSKQAIQQAIKKGKVSAAKNDNGTWEVDAAELFRVYRPLTDDVSGGVNQVDTKKLARVDDAWYQNLQLRVKELELELKIASKEKIFYEEQMTKLEAQRDEWQKQAQTLLLQNNQRMEDLQKKNGWARLFPGIMSKE